MIVVHDTFVEEVTMFVLITFHLHEYIKVVEMNVCCLYSLDPILYVLVELLFDRRWKSHVDIEKAEIMETSKYDKNTDENR